MPTDPLPAPTLGAIRTDVAVAVLLLVAAGSVAWVVLAFQGVDLRYDEAGGGCKALSPATTHALRTAAAPALLLLALAQCGASALALRQARRLGPIAPVPGTAAMVLSAVGGALLTARSYAPGHVFELVGLSFLMLVLLGLTGLVAHASRVPGTERDATRALVGVAAVQTVVVPAVVMLLTQTGEIPVC